MNILEAVKKLDELALVVGGLNGSGDDMMAAGKLISEIKASLK